MKLRSRQAGLYNNQSPPDPHSFTIPGPVVQNNVSLTSSLVDKLLTVLGSTVSSLQVFLLKKMWAAFANAKATHIFSANILAYMPYLMIKVLTIHYLTTSLVLNNWAQFYINWHNSNIVTNQLRFKDDVLCRFSNDVNKFCDIKWCITRQWHDSILQELFPRYRKKMFPLRIYKFYFLQKLLKYSIRYFMIFFYFLSLKFKMKRNKELY